MEPNVNIGQFIRSHPDHVVSAGPSGIGYSVKTKNKYGKGVGPAITALSLDELTDLLDAEDEGLRQRSSL